jgi:ornithine decarboxylase
MTPKFLISKSVMLEQYAKVQAVADIVSYSSKTNSDITPILEEETECLFSIHTANELKHVKDMSRVLFLAQGWSNGQVDDLVNKGVQRFVVDNESDLNILVSYLEKSEKKIELMLRVKLKENTLRTERYFVFGMPSKMVSEKVRELVNNPKITSLGIHFHRKTQNMAEWNLQYELQQMFEEDVFEKVDVINIGGGLPSVYANTNKDVIKSITKKIVELKEFFNSKDVKLFVEPGRFIAAPAGKLKTKIIAMYEDNIIVDASVYNSDMDAILVPVKLLVEGEFLKGKSYVIKGSTPCSLDLFRYRVYLENPKVGDVITFLNAGAYNFASDFCDLEKIKTEITD